MGPADAFRHEMAAIQGDEVLRPAAESGGQNRRVLFMDQHSVRAHLPPGNRSCDAEGNAFQEAPEAFQGFRWEFFRVLRSASSRTNRLTTESTFPVPHHSKSRADPPVSEADPATKTLASRKTRITSRF